MNHCQLLRQGDVLLLRVTAIPKDAKDETPAADVILALGEVTGHAHRIVQTKKAPKVRLWSAGAERFIQVMEATALVHEEHAPIALEGGAIYRQIHQVEERGEEVRRVAD